MRSNFFLLAGLVLAAVGMVFSAVIWTVRSASRPVVATCPVDQYLVRATVNRTEPVYICVQGTLATSGGGGR